MRHAQLQLSFYTILALFGGLVFLALFLFFGNRIYQNGQEAILRDISSRLEYEFTYGSAEQSLIKDILLPSKKFSIVCSLANGTVDDAYLRVGRASFREGTLLHIPLFMQDKFQGPLLHLWARMLQAPMKISTIVLASDDWTRFVFVTKNQPWVNELAMSLRKFRIDVISPSEVSAYTLEGKADRRYRFVFFAGNPSDISPDFRDRASILLVTSLNHGVSGTLTFIDDVASTAPDLKTEYAGKTMLLSAIFSGTSDIYACNIAKVNQLLAVDLLVMQAKNSMLFDQATPLCRPYYVQARVLLQKYQRLGVQALRQDATTINQLRHLNAALKSEGCQALY